MCVALTPFARSTARRSKVGVITTTWGTHSTTSSRGCLNTCAHTHTQKHERFFIGLLKHARTVYPQNCAWAKNNGSCTRSMSPTTSHRDVAQTCHQPTMKTCCERSVNLNLGLYESSRCFGLQGGLGGGITLQSCTRLTNAGSTLREHGSDALIFGWLSQAPPIKKTI